MSIKDDNCRQTSEGGRREEVFHFGVGVTDEEDDADYGWRPYRGKVFFANNVRQQFLVFFKVKQKFQFPKLNCKLGTFRSRLYGNMC